MSTLLGFFLIALPGLACTMVFRGVTVGSNFNVKVSGPIGSVQGLEVGLSVGGVRKVRAVTNKDGIAQFRSVQPGSYFLSADHDAGMGDGAQIDVGRAESGEITVPLSWPNAKLLSVAALKGILHLPEWIPGKPQPNVRLELLKGISGQPLKNTNTDENGAFDFSDVAPGFYFLSVKSEFGLGFIPVAVEPGVPADHLDLDVGWTSCGLSYTSQNACPQTNLHLKSLEGRIVDVANASISDAEILLLDEGRKVVEQARSDRAGSFALIPPVDGTYQLLVRRSGFTPLHGTVTFDSHGTSSPLEFELEVSIGGTCSRTKVQ